MTLCLALMLSAAHPAAAGPLDNVPLHDWTYEALDKVMAYVNYRYPTLTLPMAKGQFAEILLAIEADEQKMQELAKSKRVFALYRRLTDRFRLEIEFYRNQKQNGRFNYNLEYADRAWARLIATDVDGDYKQLPPQECRDCLWGEVGASHSAGIENYVGLHIAERVFGRYVHPENEKALRLDFLHGYLKGQIANVELEIGKDSLWWGVGRHGTLILSDNAPPFELIKFGAFRPFYLPSYWRHLGRLDIEFFITQLEKDRAVPRPYFAGIRATVSPTGYLDLGLTRTVMWGGQGNLSPRPEDWMNFIVGIAEHNEGQTTDTNQLANMELSVSLAFLRQWWWMPFKELKIGAEYGAESIHGESLRSIANLWTFYADFGPVDVRWEWVNLNTLTAWYRHFTFTDGYTYKEEIIGHPADAHAAEHFVQVAGYPATWLYLGAWWENRSRYVRSIKKIQNTVALFGRAFLPYRIDLTWSVRWWHVNRHGVTVNFPEEITTGLRVEAGIEMDF